MTLQELNNRMIELTNKMPELKDAPVYVVDGSLGLNEMGDGAVAITDVMATVTTGLGGALGVQLITQ